MDAKSFISKWERSTLKERSAAQEHFLDLCALLGEPTPARADRILPIDERAEKILKKRTLTNLYNERPQWLDHAHRALDEAVAGAYGWEADFKAGALTEEEILKRLFDLNQARASAESNGAKDKKGRRRRG